MKLTQLRKQMQSAGSSSLKRRNQGAVAGVSRASEAACIFYRNIIAHFNFLQLHKCEGVQSEWTV